MIENACQYIGKGSYSRRADVDIWDVEVGVKKMRGQNGDIIELPVKKVILSNKSKFELKRSSNRPSSDDAFLFEKCSKVILEHYERPPMILSNKDILDDLHKIHEGITNDILYYYIKKMGLQNVMHKRAQFKKEVILPMIFDAVRSLNYRCNISDIVKYLNKNDFEGKSGIEAKKSFINDVLKLNLNIKASVLSRTNTDWRAILNDYNAI